MKIDKRLNLVIPFTRSDGVQGFIHSTPIGKHAFDTHWEPMSRTFAAIYGGGYGVVAGPRIADKMLRKIATDMGVWEGAGGVRMGLLAEIYRLTNVLLPNEQGKWEMIPYEDAGKRGLLDEDDADEIQAALVFFTLASALHRRADQRPILEGAMPLWGGQLESSNCMEFRNSLPTSTVGANSGATAAV